MADLTANASKKPQNVLVCGGAGYIGSHMARLLAENGHRLTVVDNLSTGRREALGWGDFVEADIRDAAAMRRLLADRPFDAVFHFSALIVVSESVVEPVKYYDNNVVGTLNLLRAMLEAGVRRFVFSSTAAVYGNPVTDLIKEDHPLAPLNPYGRSKLMVEQMLGDLARSDGLRSVSFRYFNAAGAHPDGRIGEAHDPETHLIPNVIKSVLEPTTPLQVFGSDYPTRDGTCVRDYVHVNDLCRAHLAALTFLDREEGAHVFNLGNGRGFSVLEVIEAVRRVTGAKIAFDFAPPRESDAAVLVADSGLARERLGWTPGYEEIGDIIETAWNWHRSRGQ